MQVSLTTIVIGLLSMVVVYLLFFKNTPATETSNPQPAAPPTPAPAPQPTVVPPPSGNKEIVLFYNRQCGPCQAFKPVWDEFKSSSTIPVKEYEASERNNKMNEHKIPAFPTVRLFPNGETDLQNYKEFDGARTVTALMNFINQ